MQKEIIIVENIHCGGCVRTIESVISEIDGVVSVKADLENSSVTVEHNEKNEIVQLIKETLKEWGYPEKLK